jgi:hypothetical protein
VTKNPHTGPDWYTPLIPEDHPIYTKIGRVASSWSHLESQLDSIIWRLAGLHPRTGACITAQMLGATNRFKTIITLLKERGASSTLVTQTQKIMNTSYDVAEERNRIIHDPWYFGKQSKLTFQRKSMPSKNPRFEIEYVDDSTIEKTLKLIWDRRQKIGALSKAIYQATLAPLRKRP